MYRPNQTQSSPIKRRRAPHHMQIGESTKKQVDFGKFFRLNHEQDWCIIHITTDGLYGKVVVTSVVALSLTGQSYYVNTPNSENIFPSSLSFDAMKTFLIDALEKKCIITYDANNYTLPNLQKHFQIDEKTVEKVRVYNVLKMMRDIQPEQLANLPHQSYKKLPTIYALGLGLDSLGLVDGNKVAKLWKLRNGSANSLKLILAWSMMNALGIKYMVYLTVGKYGKQFKFTNQWTAKSDQIKVDNQRVLHRYMQDELQLDTHSEEVQLLIQK